MRRHAPWLILVAASAALLARGARYGLLGFDCYPIIAASRVRTLADFFGTFTEKLMDGRYPGDFYRPLLNLTVAADEAIWGLNAFGYQLTNVLVFAACAWAVYTLARRLVGPESRVAPIATLAVFLFHPLHAEVLPVPPRRPEFLCCLFIALSLAWQLCPRVMSVRRFPVVPALFTMLAIASKETGFVLPLLVFVAVFLFSDRGPARERARHALDSTIPHLAVVLLMILVRLAVVGGMGGHMIVLPRELPYALLRSIGFATQGLLLPQFPMQNAAGFALIVMTPAVVFGTLILGGGVKPSRDGARRRTNRSVALAIVWLLAVVFTYAAAGVIGAWYFPILVAAWAILVGALVERFVRLARRPGLVRAGALASLSLLGLLIVWQAVYSPILHRYQEWERASVAGRTFLEQAGEALAGAAPGSLVEAPPLPMWITSVGGGPVIRGGAVLADYSVQAWADLALPERNIRVVFRTVGRDRPAPDEVLLLITRRAEE